MTQNTDPLLITLTRKERREGQEDCMEKRKRRREDEFATFIKKNKTGSYLPVEVKVHTEEMDGLKKAKQRKAIFFFLSRIRFDLTVPLLEKDMLDTT